MPKIYVCGRCGYRTHHMIKCPSCCFMLEEECLKCYSAKGNCVCQFHGEFLRGRRLAKPKKAARTKTNQAIKGNKRKKSKK